MSAWYEGRVMSTREICERVASDPKFAQRLAVAARRAARKLQAGYVRCEVSPRSEFDEFLALCLEPSATPGGDSDG